MATREALEASGARETISRDELMRVREIEVRALCGEQTYPKALALFAQDGVQSPARRWTTLQAVFPVQRGRPTITRVAFDPDALTPTCGCRLDERFCQHVGALLLKWARQPESFAEVAGVAPSPPSPLPVGEGQGEGVPPSPALAAAPGRPTSPEPLEPRAEVVVSLQRLGVADLRKIARRWGLRLRGNAKEAIVEQVMAALTEPASVERAVVSLGPDPGLALAVAYLLGSDPGPRPDEVEGALRRLRPLAGEPGAVLAELQEGGLVFPDANYAGFGRIRVPRQFWVHLPPADLVALAPAPADGGIRSAGSLADTLLALHASLHDGKVSPTLRPPRRLSLLERADPALREFRCVPEEVEALASAGQWQGADRKLTVPAREPELSDESLAALASAFDLPRPAVGFAWQLLRGLALVEVGETIRATEEPARALLRLGTAGRLHAILAAWQRMEDWSELDLALEANPDLRRRRQLLPPNVSYYSASGDLGRADFGARQAEARRFIVRLLGLLPTDQWLSVEALQEAVWKLWPGFLYGRQLYAQQPTWWLETSGRQLDSRSFADWRQGPGAVVAALVAGPLHWLGLADLAGPADSPTAFRLRPGVRLPRTGPAPAGTGLARITIGPGLVVRVPVGQDDVVVHELLTAAGTLREASPRGFLYTLTIEGVRALFESGQTAESLLACFSARTERVPEEFRATLRRWGEAYGRLRLYEGLTVVELGDDYVLPELLAATGLRQHLVYQFSPRLVAVDPTGADALIAELRRRGYTPLVESAADPEGADGASSAEPVAR